MKIVGIIVTLIYVSIILVIRWNTLYLLETMPLNEFGDFFAGVFGPLMLFWLILGFIQQQNELQQNTDALILQADELKNSVQQHQELVIATNQQVEAEHMAQALDRKMKALEFITNQLDDEETLEAREYLNKHYDEICSGKLKLFNELKKNKNKHKFQLVKQYLRKLDKVGTGIMVGALDVEVFFIIWQPSWVIRQWDFLKDYIADIECELTNREEKKVDSYYKGIDYIVLESRKRLAR